MNQPFNTIIKFSYYKNRIIATLALMIGVFNPILGFPLAIIAYYLHRQGRHNPLIKQNKDDNLFIIAAMVVLGLFLIIYFVTLVKTFGEVIGTSSESLISLF